jgi:hypothetical protein
MNLGMLWLDISKNRTFEEKVDRAAAYYSQKYGHAANTCFVSKDAISAEKLVGTIQVMPAENILPHHFWLGNRASV